MEEQFKSDSSLGGGASGLHILILNQDAINKSSSSPICPTIVSLLG